MATTVRSCKGKKAPLRYKPGGEDAELLVHLQTLRWPHGFECPGCRFSCSAKGDDAAYQRLMLAPRHVPKSFDELRRARGLIICPHCKKQVSMTSGTLLARTRLPLSVVYRAAGEFLKAPFGVSAPTLKRAAGLKDQKPATRLLDLFPMAMEPGINDRLAGNVQIEEFATNLEIAGTSSMCRIIVAAENRNGGETGRIQVLWSHEPSGMYWIPHRTCPIGGSAHVELRRGNIENLVRSWGFTPTTIHGEDTNPLALCSAIFVQIDGILRKVDHDLQNAQQVQTLLDEFSYRWNRRGRDDQGLEELMSRLLTAQK